MNFIRYDISGDLDKCRKLIVELDINSLMEVLLIANYLKITNFVKLSQEYFKRIIRDNSVDDIRKIFKLPDDLTQEINE